ncbi:MAG: fibronectin type III domain-containing protein [Acidimicrobiales bacterium]
MKATATAEGIELSWTTSSDNIGVTGYEVRRSTDGTVGPVIATVALLLPRRIDRGDRDLHLRHHGDRQRRQPELAKQLATIQETTSVDTERPSPPQGLVVDSVAAAEVVLSWKPSTDNVGVSRYIVFRSEAGATAVEVGRSSTRRSATPPWSPARTTPTP